MTSPTTDAGAPRSSTRSNLAGGLCVQGTVAKKEHVEAIEAELGELEWADGVDAGVPYKWA